MLDKTIESIKNEVIGNEFKIKISIATILCGGHILIEDLPGTGKTTFAKSITRSLNLDFKRIQFTSDLYQVIYWVLISLKMVFLK